MNAILIQTPRKRANIVLALFVILVAGTYVGYHVWSFVNELRDGLAAYSRNESLSEAALKGDSVAVRLWLARGANPNYSDPPETSVLGRAWQSGDKKTIDVVLSARPDLSKPLTDAVISDDASFVRFLLTRGANPNARYYDGRKLVDVAKTSNRTEVYEMLRNAGAKLSAR